MLFNHLFRITVPVTYALSCSMIYVMSIDYYYRTYPTVKWTTPFKYKYLLNPGLILGGLTGIVYLYLGEPKVPCLLKNK
jgi:hypothetical protein